MQLADRGDFQQNTECHAEEQSQQVGRTMIPCMLDAYHQLDINNKFKDCEVDVWYVIPFENDLSTDGHRLADHLSYALKRFVAFRDDAAKRLEVVVHALPHIQLYVRSLRLRLLGKITDHVV